MTVEEAAQAAHVEVQSQIDRWGEVEDSTSFSFSSFTSLLPLGTDCLLPFSFSSPCSVFVPPLRHPPLSQRTTSTTRTFAFVSERRHSSSLLSPNSRRKAVV